MERGAIPCNRQVRNFREDMSEAKNTLTKVVIEDSKKQELDAGVLLIEGLLKDSVDHQNGEQVAEQLMKACELLHTSGRLMEIATRNINLARGRGMYMIVTDARTRDLQATVQKNIVEGAIAEYIGDYARVERTTKNLIHYLDGLRTLVSKNKEQEKMNNYNANS